MKNFSQTFDNYDVSITMKSVGHLRDFYAFGIYGRDFNLDSDPGAAGTFKTTSGLVVISLTIAIFMNLFSV